MKKIMTKLNEKGFTLMEMLVVVAIIAILVAIAFPIFNKQLNRARVATDAANIRTGYASAANVYLEKGRFNTLPSSLHVDGSIDNVGSAYYKTKGDATQADCKDIVESIKSCGVSNPWDKGMNIRYEIVNKEIQVVFHQP